MPDKLASMGYCLGKSSSVSECFHHLSLILWYCPTYFEDMGRFSPSIKFLGRRLYRDITNLDIALSCCGPKIFLWNFTEESCYEEASVFS